jgi:hypothetical protein
MGQGSPHGISFLERSRIRTPRVDAHRSRTGSAVRAGRRRSRTAEPVDAAFQVVEKRRIETGEGVDSGGASFERVVDRLVVVVSVALRENAHADFVEGRRAIRWEPKACRPHRRNASRSAREPGRNCGHRRSECRRRNPTPMVHQIAGVRNRRSLRRRGCRGSRTAPARR